MGYTPLMGAASAGRDDLVNLLLARGADPAAVSEDGKTAASLAREHGHETLAVRLAPQLT
jgi:ankyrin repeat protein